MRRGVSTFAQASTVALTPRKIDATLAFMFESRYVIRPTRFALEAPQLQSDYLGCWQGLTKRFTGKP